MSESPRVVLALTEARENMAMRVAEYFMNYYAQSGVSWPTGKMSELNALCFRFFMEGLQKYGVDFVDEQHFRFNEEVCRRALERKSK